MRVGSLALAVAGVVVMLVVTGGDAWPLALAWIGAMVVFALIWRPLRSRRLRVIAGVIAAVALVGLTWEGGLFLLPAVLAAVVVRP